MYRKSFFIVLLSLLLVGLFSVGTQFIAMPSVSGLPSAYDSGLSIEDAVKTSETPLLVEFYTDTCRTCQLVTPMVHQAGQAFEDELTLVMVDVNVPEEAYIADIFGVEYVPAIYVFDFNHMKKEEVALGDFVDQASLNEAIRHTLTKVETASKKTVSP